MAVSFTTIAQAIKTQLTAVTELKTVVLGRNADHSAGFPFCRIYLIGVGDELKDQKSFLRTYRFAIEIIQETTAKTKENAELDWGNAVDAVMTKLNQNWQLGAGVERTMIESSVVRTAEVNGGPMVALAINYAVSTLVQTT